MKNINKKILYFVGKFTLFYFLITIVTLNFSLDQKLASIYQNFGNKWLNSIGDKGIVVFQTPKKTPSANSVVIKSDTEILLLNKEQAQKAIVQAQNTRTKAVDDVTVKFDVSSWYFGFMPMLLFLCLTLSSPVSLRRLMIGLAIGFVLLASFIGFKTWIFILHKVHGNPWLELTQFTGWSETLLLSVFQLVAHLGSSLFVSVFVWLATIFRLEDWQENK